MSLSWTPPRTNTDGSPLTNLAGYRVYWGTQRGSYPNSVTLNDAGLASHIINNLAPATWYSVVTAVNSSGVESAFSNVASKTIEGPPPEPPGPVRNLEVTVAPPVVVQLSRLDGTVSPELDLSITGSADVQIRLAAGNEWDWCKPGGVNGSTVTPTTPALGLNNNDGTRSQTITLRGPVTTRCDIDDTNGAAFAGGTVTVNGVTKPLALSSGAWSVSF